MRRYLWFAVVTSFSVFAQIRGDHPGIGSPPEPRLHSTDIFSAFSLPALNDGDGSPVQTIASGLQMWRRAKTLNLTSRSAIDAWKQAQPLLPPANAPARSTAMPGVPVVVFSGASASALNQLLGRPGTSSVQVTSPALTIDEPIEIQKNGVTLDFGNAQIGAGNPQPYMLRIENASNVVVTGGNFVHGDSAILINACTGVTVSNVRVASLTGDGIVVTRSSRVTLDGNRISAIQMAGIVIHRGTSGSLIENNEIIGDTGTQNAAGAILVTDREVDLASNPRAIFASAGYGIVPQPMSQRLNPPHDNLIAFNQLLRNNSSGIYVDGAVRTVIYSNTIESNAKEGMCLDNGATANVVASNIVQDNGDRWGESNVVLQSEFIAGAGRLADGTAVNKVPGISLDNALYNIVFGNNVSNNFGGGVKIVRTGYFNSIGMNTILNDNDGASAHAHFFGIELGAAHGDQSSIEIDFTPSRGNVVFSNLIRGTHYSGIFFDVDSDRNQVLDNVIMDAVNWALEAVKQMPANVSLNNLTNLPSRNIGSGLDPALVTSGQPVNDPPTP